MKLAGAYINDDTYERLVALATACNRTLAGQCRHLFDRALNGELRVPDCTPAAPAPPPRVLAGAAAEAAPDAGAFHADENAEAGAAPALPAAGTLPVAGGGVGAVVPMGIGNATTPWPPATGHPPSDARGSRGTRDGGRISTPMMTYPPTPATPRRARRRPQGTAPAPDATPHAPATPHSKAAPASHAAPPAPATFCDAAPAQAAPETPHAMGRDAR